MKNSKLLFTICAFLCISHTYTKSADELTNFKNILEKSFKDSLQNAYNEVENQISQKSNAIKKSNFHKQRKLETMIKKSEKKPTNIIIRKLIIKKKKQDPKKQRKLTFPFEIMGPLHFLQGLENERNHRPQIHGVITEIKKVGDGHGHFVTQEFHKNLNSNDVLNMTNNFENGIFPDLQNSQSFPQSQEMHIIPLNSQNGGIHIIPLNSENSGIHIIPLNSFHDSSEEDFHNLIPLNEEQDYNETEEQDHHDDHSDIAEMLGNIISQNTHNLSESITKPEGMYHQVEIEPDMILNNPANHEIEITKTIPMAQFIQEGPQKVIGDIINQISGNGHEHVDGHEDLHNVISNIVENNEHVRRDDENLNPFGSLNVQNEDHDHHGALSLGELLNRADVAQEPESEHGLTLEDILSGNMPHEDHDSDEDHHELTLGDILSGNAHEHDSHEDHDHPQLTMGDILSGNAHDHDSHEEHVDHEGMSLGDLLSGNVHDHDSHEDHEDHHELTLGDILSGNAHEHDSHEDHDHPQLTMGDILSGNAHDHDSHEEHVDHEGMSLGDLLSGNVHDHDSHEDHEDHHELTLGNILSGNTHDHDSHEDHEDHHELTLGDILSGNAHDHDSHEDHDHHELTFGDILSGNAHSTHEEDDHPHLTLQDILQNNTQELDESHEEEDHPHLTLADILRGNRSQSPYSQEPDQNPSFLSILNNQNPNQNKKRIYHKNSPSHFPKIGHMNKKAFQPSFGDILSKLFNGVQNQQNENGNGIEQSHEGLNHFEHVETPTHHYLTKIDAEHHQIPKENEGILPMILQGMMGMGDGETRI